MKMDRFLTVLNMNIFFLDFFYYGCLVRLTAHGNMSVSFYRVGPLTYIREVAKKVYPLMVRP